MRAVTYSAFGPAKDVLTLVQMDTPTPAAGEVLVQLEYSGANPSDAKARAGARPGVTKPAFDVVIPNSDGAGVITAVGQGVDPARIGSRVWIWNGQWQRPFGTCAECIALPADQAVDMPDDMSMETGACLGIPGLTAAHAVLGGGDIAGQTLLISGGAGSVGHNAIQLAKWAGATVIATGSPDGFDRMTAAGADHVLEYRAADLADQILACAPNGVDRAVEVEFGANADLLHRVVRGNGTIAAYGSGKDMTPTFPFGPYLFKAITIDIVLIYILPKPERDAAIDALHRGHAAGAFVPAVHHILALEDSAAAHDATMTPGRAGAVLIKIR
jgi:NADPH2:quinone reductase